MPKPKDWFYPTAYSTWGEEEQAAIDRVLYSERFTQGEEVAAFEEEFATFHRRGHAIMVNSGSSANLIAVGALVHSGKIKRGKQALVPALAWSTTYAPLIQYGLDDLVLIDCGQDWNADPYCKAMNEINPETVGLVVGCSILGVPAALDTWRTIASTLGVPLLEDNCESLGAVTDYGIGRRTGCFGDISTSSLFYSHQVSAIEGGVILTDDNELADLCRILRAHGWTRDVWYDDSNPDVEKPSFVEEYEFILPGYNVRGLELHAAIAREQLRKLPAMAGLRYANAMEFERQAMAAGIWSYDGEHIQLVSAQPGDSRFGIHFMVPAAKRQALANALREAGVDCRLPTGGSLRLHPYGQPWASQATPRADEIHVRGMFLGNGALNLTPQIVRAVGELRAVLMP